MADEEENIEDTEYLEEEEGNEEEQEAEDEGKEAEEVEEAVDANMSALKEVQDKSFDEVRLPTDIVAEAQTVWQTFIGSSSSREAAGEAIYAALFDSAPSLQSLFKTPRSVMAMRFMNGLNSIIGVLGNSKELKITVETLGFQHLDLEVTVPRVVIFRDAIIDLFDMEMGSRFTSKAKLGFGAMLNYVGGAYIYIRREYAVRIKIINTSWKTANNKAADLMDQEDDEMAADLEAKEAEEGEEGEDGKQDKDDAMGAAEGKDLAQTSGEAGKSNDMRVPTTFNEMFLFNAAVMGFGSSTWMQLILDQFDNMVMNVANSYRLQEECDVLSLVLSKYKGNINLGEFKAVMLASLRSLVPKDWNSDHEVAWSWLWENVERMLKNLLGKPAVQERALERLIMSLTEDAVNYLRREVYKRFFALAPAGQDYFKQSTTRLYWIADKIVEMTLEIYRDPKKMVEDISALGLRHVGYAIPTEFFAPFVSGAVEVVRSMTTDDNAEDAFRWSLTLISKILVRTILEGSTIVMKAINTNNEKSLRKAISVAPRGKRSLELLNITVGTQSISPFYWAIESGSLVTAEAMIKDLLVIRADRDNYYYGCDDLFIRHPDVVQHLNQAAAGLLPTLFDGLVWRSRVAVNGQRRVNYYVKHLIQDTEGNFNEALEWLVDGNDPKIICHPVVVIFADLLWNRLASRFFLTGRCYYLCTLLVFITSQSILPHLNQGAETEMTRIVTFACRACIYVGSMGALLRAQVLSLRKDIKEGNFSQLGCLKIPEYLTHLSDITSLWLLLALVLMCSIEPIFWCMGSGADLFTSNCSATEATKEAYVTISMMAMFLYWGLLLDLTILSMRISAFFLVCGSVISELLLFLGGLAFLIIAFASSISVLNHTQAEFQGIPKGALSLMEIALGMFPTEQFESMQEEPTMLMAVSLFIIISLVFLLNLLVAQLNGAYQAIYDDMFGYARLTRGRVIVTTIRAIGAKRWKRFLQSLKLDEPMEFNEGDIGLAGGIQETEPSNANPTTVDMIKRFGGSTSPALQWPEEEGAADDDDDKFDRLEKVILRATKKMEGSKGGSKSGAGASSMGQSGASGGLRDRGKVPFEQLVFFVNFEQAGCFVTAKHSQAFPVPCFSKGSPDLIPEMTCSDGG
eukprot:CAMPEP_0197657622 /NCGR_PEP_ID=MMETSP1338-20131121/44744_1 /TAXON_ID=43686 ORGANISM="Pelagodinium beii, Strain RCC1491" /NCGR_SAMPLE_ID=MMETSP1338 /ASSEMBLY_ACC=CAM_ASM_000754 /LENGTH=1138 /DNA_ID=CAMNT_0043234037 /DNA_START=86 /DNA_END=3499 /DNA_ORIENTATION=+